MSDFDVSSSDSEPVSDVNPEEMARLMADLDDIDSDLFKGNLKSSAKVTGGRTDPKIQDGKQSSRQENLDKKPVTPAKPSGKASDDDSDDWDADDLLHSDEIRPRGQLAKNPDLSDKLKSSSGKASDSRKKDENDIDESTKKAASKSKLMADLFNDNSEDVTKESKMTKSPKKDKSKLMNDLFGGADDSSPDKFEISAAKTTARRGTAKKVQDDDLFDDGDDLLGGLESKQKPGSGKDPVKGGSFLDSLLKKSSAETPKKMKEKSLDFVLDDKYKKTGKDTKEENVNFGDYKPSAAKLDSPKRRTPKKSVANDNFDLFSDNEARRRNPRSAPQRKTFEVDDDDILKNVRSRKDGSKESSKDAIPSAPSSNKKIKETAKSPTKNQNKNDWLFGDSGSVAEFANKNMDDTPITASIDQDDSVTKPSPSKNQDWLGSLLSSNKKSPSVSKKVTSQDNSASAAPSVALSNSVAVTASPSVHIADTGQGSVAPTTHSVQVSSAPSTFSVPAPVPTMLSLTPTVEVGHLSSELEHQFMKQQQEAHAQAAAIAAQLQQNQNQLQMHVAQQLQQQQQQHMVDLMKKQQQEAALMRCKDAVSTVPLNTSIQLNNSENHQKVEIDLRAAEVEVEKLKTELNLLRKQHAEEVALLEEGHRRTMEVEKEVWDRVEKRLREERDSLLSDFQMKMSLVQEEKENLASSYESQLASIKSEWSQAVERTKELYSGMIERMKEEHHAALERISQLKELELKAVISASGQVREVETVMTQLENNTSNLSELTASINIRHDSALELTQRALKMKEKQLQEFEAQLAASRAESENERSRLNTLIQRLESTLMLQGSEVEKERWRLAQERMKIEMERQAMVEERRHLQTSTETERQNLATARESLMAEHRSLLQSVNQQKQELASQQAYINIQQKLAHVSTLQTNINGGTMTQMDVAAEMNALKEEHRCLREKITAVNCHEQQLNEEEARVEQLKLQLEQEKAKLKLNQDILVQEKMFMAQTQKEIEETRKEVDVIRHEQEIKFNQITSQTRALHMHQERIENENLKLEQLKEEVIRLSKLGLCATCRTKGAGEFLLERLKPQNGRLPGDGGEGHISSSLKVENHNINMSPASVLARLAAARGHENVEREKRLLQISCMESS
nr:fas-binding factor 1 homolog isoform X2 [Cherax quadricarinatus]XP_053635516.1 fas-binding factor 1 homolog isoform X2 [Cherax quadricarinatus]XP_053635517.1 fas-binding factor 1 homolog isoform X2 [Cherax quadricarinatus]